MVGGGVSVFIAVRLSSPIPRLKTQKDRFRYTLYDGLQLKHLFGLIAVLCNGAALMGSAVAAYTLWTIR